MKRESRQQQHIEDFSLTRKEMNEGNHNGTTSSLQVKSESAESLGDILTQRGLKRPERVNKPKTVIQRNYVAQEIADKLDDPKSLGCYRKIAEKIPQEVVFDVLSNVKDVALSGKIRQSRGALFVEIIKKYASGRGIELGFKPGRAR